MPINRHIRVRSANIAAIGYDPEPNILEIVFGANPKEVYRYQNVTPLQYAMLMNASSIGSHFGMSQIKKNTKAHPFTKDEFKGKIE